MDIPVGTRLGPYEVVAPIGAGGMGEVYRARDTRLGREVAVKVMRAAATADEDRRHRFAREARAASALSHPNIATVYDVGEAAGVHYIAMELVEGRTLASRIADGPLPPREVIEVASQVAEALDEAHSHGILHRDIKPANLIVTPRGRVKVFDFGLARLDRSDVQGEITTLATRDGTTVGTVPYMSPEQALGRDVDGRSDVFSLGVAIFEMATGRRPFGGETSAEIADRILHADLPAMARLADDIPPELERIVRKCLEKDRERRYQSARDLAVDLSNLKRLLESGSLDVAVTPLPAAARTKRVAPTWIWVAALVAVGVMAGLATRVWLGRRAASPDGRIELLAVLPLANMTGDAAQEYFADGMTEALITELARSRVRVVSRTSVMRFKKTDKTLPEIARQLGVDGIVQGAVMRSAGRVRVTAQLVRASTDENVWADTFDRNEEDVLVLDSEIASAIAGRVHTALGPAAATRAAPRRKVKPEAYDLVLQGTHLIKSGGTPEALKRAISLFEKAVALDGQSVEAHAGLANALGTLTGMGFAAYWDLYPRIRKEVDAAEALDPTYPWVHIARGDLLYAERNPRGALNAYRRAVELDPTNSTAVSAVGYMTDILEPGPEGERLLRQAVVMDPLAQVLRCNLMTKMYAQRRFEEARAEALAILDLDPNWFWARDALWRMHALQGKVAEAQAESRKAWLLVFGDTFTPPPNVSWDVYERWLDGFLARQNRTWVNGFLAAASARRGEKEKALAHLEAAAASNNVFMGQLDFPDFDSIREEPRFRRIVEDRHLPVAAYCRLPRAGGPR